MNRTTKLFCDDIENVENYYKALSDKENIWHCHHRLETHFSGGTPRPKNAQISKKELIALGMYWHRPATEFIFITQSEHMSLHNKDNKAHLGHHHSVDTKKRISEKLKGRPSPTKNTKWTEERRTKMNYNGENNSMYRKHHNEDSKKKIAYALKGKDIICIETGEVHYDKEWRRLGYLCAARVAKGLQDSCKGLHFKYVCNVSIDPDIMLELIANGLKESAKWNQRDC